MDDGVKILSEKLSAALVNVGAKEDLVKQHSKVAEEAVSGWEKSENEVSVLKQQLEAVMQENSVLEDRGNHLDRTLKECARQLRQGREEQEHKILEAILGKTHEWEYKKADLESQIEFLQRENFDLKVNQTKSPTSVDSDLLSKLEYLERKNEALKHELLSLSEELEIMTIERDLSAQAAENASKQHLVGIKKAVKLEAQCRKLQALNRKSSLSHDQKTISASSIYVESVTDSQSDNGERSNPIIELDKIKSEKSLRSSITSSPLEMDIMDDFLEMERLVTQPKPETKDKKQYGNVNNEQIQLKADFNNMCHHVSELEEKLKNVEAEKEELVKVLVGRRSSYEENQLNADFEATSRRVLELEEKLKAVQVEKNEMEKVLACRRSSYEENQLKADFKAASHRVLELEEKLKTMETEKTELVSALAASRSAYEESQFQLKSSEMRVEAITKELNEVNASKEVVEFQLTGIETKAGIMSSKVDLLKEEIEKEKSFSKEIAVKCRGLEDELDRRSQKIELQQDAMANSKAKVQQEELEVATGKLAECKKTIASIGRQLQSLATLEDFLTDTANLPGFSSDSRFWKLHSSDTLISKNSSDQTKVPVKDPVPLLNDNFDKKSPRSL